MNPGDFKNERARRFALQASLRAVDPTLKAIPASIIRGLGVYGRYRGTYTELASSDDGTASPRIALSMLHTGRHYADDLSENSLIYHYPATGQPGLDRSDIDAGKTALLLKLPVFVVLYPTVGDSDREVKVAYVIEADDANKQFLLSFGEQPPAVSPPIDEAGFAATISELLKKRRTSNVRANDQARFAFDVAKRYGKKCAVCQIRVSALLDAAHIIPVSRLGSDDARNGLPLCKNHHRAFDAGLFHFEAESFIVVAGHGHELKDLGVSEATITTESGSRPHPDAIALCNELRAPKSA
ncbi:MAG: HNH endonuclease [Luteimonas sp.]